MAWRLSFLKFVLACDKYRAYIRSCRDVPTVLAERDRQFSLATMELWKGSGETPPLRSGIQPRGRRKAAAKGKKKER
jgi:hypothetical protein